MLCPRLAVRTLPQVGSRQLLLPPWPAYVHARPHSPPNSARTECPLWKSWVRSAGRKHVTLAPFSPCLPSGPAGPGGPWNKGKGTTRDEAAHSSRSGVLSVWGEVVLGSGEGWGGHSGGSRALALERILMTPVLGEGSGQAGGCPGRRECRGLLPLTHPAALFSAGGSVQRNTS